MIWSRPTGEAGRTARTPCADSRRLVAPESSIEFALPPSGLSARVQTGVGALKATLNAPFKIAEFGGFSIPRRFAQNPRTLCAGSIRSVPPEFVPEVVSTPSGLCARVQISLEGLSRFLQPSFTPPEATLHSVGEGQSARFARIERRRSISGIRSGSDGRNVCLAPGSEAVPSLQSRSL